MRAAVLRAGDLLVDDVPIPEPGDGQVIVRTRAWVDENDYLYLTDRANFMIILGGVNIYPQEVENALIEHPKVADAAVFGLPDTEMGQRVVAEELTAYLRTRISAVKLPRQVLFRASLPREPTGKLLKQKMMEALRGSASV